MRKHGKCFAAFLAVMLFATASFSAAAYNEQDILNFVKGKYTVGNEVFSFKDDQIVRVERYLSEYDVSDEACDVVMANFQKIKAIFEKNGSTNLQTLSTQDKTDIISAIENSAKAVGLEAGLLLLAAGFGGAALYKRKKALA